MNPKKLYLGLCVAGAAIPYAAFLPWLAVHGLNLRLFVQELLVSRVSVFFGLDVLVSAAVVILFATVERRRVSLRFRWAVALALLLVGVSLALPLFLYLQEIALEKSLVSPIAPAVR